MTTSGDGGGKRGFWQRLVLRRQVKQAREIKELMTEPYRQMLADMYKVDASGMTLDQMRQMHKALLTPTGDEPTSMDVLKWLKRNGPAEWHRSAATWNWDFDLEPMRWVIRQANCDAGTAIMLFARGEPGYYQKFSSMDELETEAGYLMETVRFLIEICERWATGQYAEYRLKPVALPHVRPGSLPWYVPQTLGMAEAQGEELDLGGWNEGMPPEMLTPSWRRSGGPDKLP